MRELRVPLKAVQRLTDKQRYTYYLLGHMFNELMCLQKLIGFSLPKHNDLRPSRRSPEFAQSFLLFRLASAKVWEGAKILNSSEVSEVLRTDMLPRLLNGPARLKEVNQRIAAARWLSGMRNGISFHFPSFAQWLPFVTPDTTWIHDAIYLGSETGNTFYEGSEAIARHWMFAQMDPMVGAEAVNGLIQEMISLLKLMNSFVEDALGAFVFQVMLQGNVPEAVGKVTAPEFKKVVLPFWTHMAPAGREEEE